MFFQAELALLTTIQDVNGISLALLAHHSESAALNLSTLTWLVSFVIYQETSIAIAALEMKSDRYVTLNYKTEKLNVKVSTFYRFRLRTHARSGFCVSMAWNFPKCVHLERGSTVKSELATYLKTFNVKVTLAANYQVELDLHHRQTTVHLTSTASTVVNCQRERVLVV